MNSKLAIIAAIVIVSSITATAFATTLGSTTSQTSTSSTTPMSSTVVTSSTATSSSQSSSSQNVTSSTFSSSSNMTSTSSFTNSTTSHASISTFQLYYATVWVLVEMSSNLYNLPDNINITYQFAGLSCVSNSYSCVEYENTSPVCKPVYDCLQLFYNVTLTCGQTYPMLINVPYSGANGNTSDTFSVSGYVFANVGSGANETQISFVNFGKSGPVFQQYPNVFLYEIKAC